MNSFLKSPLKSLATAALLWSATGHAETYSASYEVPVPQALASVATFAIGDATLTTDEAGTPLTLSYLLPLDIVQTALRRVTLARVGETRDGFYEMRDSDASAWCQKTGAAIACLVHYTFGVALNQTTHYIETTYSDRPTAEVQDRVQVASTFASDPVGILKIWLPTAP